MQQQPSSKIGNEKKKAEITTEFCRELIGGKQSAEEGGGGKGKQGHLHVLMFVGGSVYCCCGGFLKRYIGNIIPLYNTIFVQYFHAFFFVEEIEQIL